MTEAIKDKSKEMLIPVGIVGVIITTAIGWGRTEAQVKSLEDNQIVIKAEVRDMQKDYHAIDKKLNIIGYRLGLKHMEDVGKDLEE